MKCRNIKNMLSEYIDGMLGEEDASLIREHLDHCADCMEEYEALTRIVGYMSQMESLETPEYFLQKVKKRLEKPFSFERLKRRLFVPLQIKLPLELAGITVVLMLVVHFSGVLEKRHLYDVVFSMRAQAIPEIQEEEQPGERRGEKGERGGKKGEEKRERGADVTDTGKRQEKKGESEKGEKKGENLEEIISSLGGRVIKSEYRKDRNILENLIIEIPIDSYQAFFQKLEKLGEIQKPYPVIKEDQEIVKIRIRVQYFD